MDPQKRLASDKEKCITAGLFSYVGRTLKMKGLLTTIYHPETDEQVEYYNSTLKAAIQSYLKDHPKDWDIYRS